MLRTHSSISCQRTHEPTSEETHCYSFQLNAQGEDLSSFSRFEGKICFRCSLEGSLVWLMKSQSSKIPSWEILLGTMRLEQRNFSFAGGLLLGSTLPWGPDPVPESGLLTLSWWLQLLSPGSHRWWFHRYCLVQSAQTAIERHMYNQTSSDNQTHLSTLKKSRL